jgi:CubicO group peptidase (beta-lactamase class C family)
MAAAGLWTTPSDLARYCIETERSLQGKANHVLSQDLTQQMVTPGKGEYGFGLQIGGSAADPYFSHGGVNAGFESLFVAYEHHGDGAVVMTNAQGGLRLATEVMQSIATEYGWPDFRPIVHTQVDRLMTQATNQPKFPVFPESQTKFFLRVVDAQVEFFTDDKGQVSYMMLHQTGRDIKGVKK